MFERTFESSQVRLGPNVCMYVCMYVYYSENIPLIHLISAGPPLCQLSHCFAKV